MEFDHVVVMASDLALSRAWYEVVMPALGFESRRDHVWVNAAGQALDLRQAEDLSQPYLRRGVGVNHLAVRADGEDAMHRALAAIRAAGLETPAVQTFGADLAVFLKDPDGLRIEIAVYG